MDGIVNIWKPSGMTSHDVVACVRRAAMTRRVGHTGTLDPMAEGVLPICVGKATHAVDYVVKGRKTYQCTMRLGQETDTQDSTGTVTAEKDVSCTMEDVRRVMASFVGEQTQIPPMYSAVHHNGVRLYQLARKGIQVERKPRKVTFYDIRLLNTKEQTVTFLVECTKGTYIRTLCHDMGRKLGCGAHMTALIRTKCGQFSRENAVDLPVFLENPAAHLLPTETVFSEYERITVDASDEKRIRNGAVIINPKEDAGTYTVFSADGTFLCLSKGVKIGETNVLQMITSFY